MQSRNLKIDVLRGLSIIFVILLHLNIRVPFNTTELGEIVPKALYKLLFWSGFYGVSIFFVVSGFLITTSALKRWGSLTEVKLWDFYKMRFARIFPLLTLLLLVLSLFDVVGVEGFVVGSNNDATLPMSLLSAFTFSINWYEMAVGYLPGAWDILWSLSIEEVFYVLFPIVCLVIRKERSFVFFMVLFIVVAPLFRTMVFADNELGDRNNLACMDGIALGCIAALVANRKSFKPSSLLVMQILGWAMFGAVMLMRTTLYELGISKVGLNVTLMSIGVALLLICWHKQYEAGRNRVAGALSWLGFFGRNSYEVYLTHMFVVMAGVALFEYCGEPTEWCWLLYVGVLVLSGVLGEVVAKYFSNPLNGYLRRRFNRR